MKKQQQLCSRYYVEDRSSDINVYFSLDLSFFDFSVECVIVGGFLGCFVLYFFCLFGLFPQLSFLYRFCRYWFKQKGDAAVCASGGCGMNATPKKAKLFITTTTREKNCGKNDEESRQQQQLNFHFQKLGRCFLYLPLCIRSHPISLVVLVLFLRIRPCKRANIANKIHF